MSTHDIRCCGPHDGPGPVLGTVTVPDGSDPAPVTDGSLCGDCGDVYVRSAGDRHAPGSAPGADDVADILPGLRPGGWKPAGPYRRPSWAQRGDPAWPPPARPKR